MLAPGMGTPVGSNRSLRGAANALSGRTRVLKRRAIRPCRADFIVYLDRLLVGRTKFT
jgi:hypothetical protein